MEVEESSSGDAPRIGRQPATSNAQLSHLGLQLFIERGFDATTIDDIASAAGIGRRTFFRYFSSKNDLPWGDFDTMIASMRAYLFALPRTSRCATPFAPRSSSSIGSPKTSSSITASGWTSC
ncbi:hypothetical protein GCM10025867_43630 [Frondihabitans sucicola]|uniref:HTH tetR-type domain-containing protein n=1 Tax=Frondihabitans sucicola TaxID=1268041 RepID=A0ABN6Y447_9MICO|nr:TetR family transcriptional regulator [Frondihabitans sucicola]BDZ52122.1 hypothetical protein GCM10025867_43630 [Frondihabitans sucicola]